jgi:hypothetical protein
LPLFAVGTADFARLAAPALRGAVRFDFFTGWREILERDFAMASRSLELSRNLNADAGVDCNAGT